MMEHTGPGTLTRFWTPYFHYSFGKLTGPNIRIYLDGSTASNSSQGFNVNTRTRILDAIPFHQRLLFDMEASAGTGQRNAWDLLMYSSVVYWYARPGATSNRPPLPAAAAQPITSFAELQARSDLIKNGGVLVVPGAIEGEDQIPSASSPRWTPFFFKALEPAPPRSA